MSSVTRRCVSAAISAMALMMVLSSVAKANTVIGYSVSGSFNDGGSLSGSFSIDWTADTVISMAMNTTAGSVLTGRAYTIPLTFFEIIQNGPPCQTNCTFVGGSGNPGEILALVFHVGPALDLTFLQSFSGTGAAAASGEANGTSFRLFTDATISETATPLPAALSLFASGAGVIGLLARRRPRKRAA